MRELLGFTTLPLVVIGMRDHLDNKLVFLKLGGSLITHKDLPETPRLDLIHALAEKIQQALEESPSTRLVLGHGSGSFGHMAAKRHNTREGVFTPIQWQGFHQTWQSARKLHTIMLDALLDAGVPVISFPPSAMIITEAHQIKSWHTETIQAALADGMIPLLYGDVVFDSVIGGTILSTEDLFFHLATVLQPSHILLAGIEAGVWADYPTCSQLVKQLSSCNMEVRETLLPSASVDVTGGMQSKVNLMCQLVNQIPGLQVRIFSACNPEDLYRAISGEALGTLIS